MANLANMLQRTYRVEFETDLKTKQVTARLPTLRAIVIEQAGLSPEEFNEL